jgi:hypothetical protein
MFNPTSWFVFVGFPVDEAVAAIKMQRPGNKEMKIIKNTIIFFRFRCGKNTIWFKSNRRFSNESCACFL